MDMFWTCSLLSKQCPKYVHNVSKICPCPADSARSVERSTPQPGSLHLHNTDRRLLPMTHHARSFSALGRHCSLWSRRITHTDRHHLPIAHVACSLSAHGRHCLLRSSRITHAVERGLIWITISILMHQNWNPCCRRRWVSEKTLISYYPSPITRFFCFYPSPFMTAWIAINFDASELRLWLRLVPTLQHVCF